MRAPCLALQEKISSWQEVKTGIQHSERVTEKYQTPFISSAIAVLRYIINTAFTSIYTSGSQCQCVKHLRSGSPYWELFCQRSWGELGKVSFVSVRCCPPFSRHWAFCLFFLPLNLFHSSRPSCLHPMLPALFLRVSRFLLFLCPHSINFSNSYNPLYSASYTPEDEFDFLTSNMGGTSLTPVVSFVWFLNSNCLGKKICQDAGLLMNVRITKSTDLWKTKRSSWKTERTTWILPCIVLCFCLNLYVPKWLTWRQISLSILWISEGSTNISLIESVVNMQWLRYQICSFCQIYFSLSPSLFHFDVLMFLALN